MKNQFFLICFFLLFVLGCKSKDEKFYDYIHSKNLILWSDTVKLKTSDFQFTQDHKTSLYYVGFGTLLKKGKHEFEYYVYLDKDKSYININQQKKNIRKEMAYAIIRMNAYEYNIRKIKKDFLENNKIVSSKGESDFYVSLISRQTDRQLDSIDIVIREIGYEKNTLDEINNNLKKLIHQY